MILARGGGDYWLYIIVRSIIGFMQSRGTLERTLLLSPLVYLPPSSRVYKQTLYLRATLSLSRTPELSAKSCSASIRGLKGSVQRDALLDSTGLQSAMFLADRLARLLDRSHDFFTLAHICHARL